MDASGRENVHEVVNILHREEFSLNVFKGLVKCNRDFQVITENVINENIGS